MKNKHSIVFMGATGAVGSAALDQLLKYDKVSRLLTLGRRTVEAKALLDHVEQQIIDIHNTDSYADFIHDIDTAVCTLGVGESSKVPKEEFIRIDKTAVLKFAKVCKEKGVNHFHLLSSIGSNSGSMNYYLRTKGELNDELVRMGFERLSIYQPSMIMTPQNRYGWTQGIALKIWPKFDHILHGGYRKYRGIKVDMLGKAIANNVFVEKTGVEFLQYDDFLNLQKRVS